MHAFLKQAAALCVALGGAVAAPAGAQDHSRMYSRAELSADAARLEKAWRNIYRIGLERVLTPEERAGLRMLRLDFPRPERGDYALDFYTYEYNGENILAAPILSLKTAEDLTTAYAWLYSQKYSLEPIDLYFALMRRADPSGFPGGRHPPILKTLGVPQDAYKHAPVDKLSLSLRNEAFAFILAHELGHIVLKHKPYNEITVAQARADEVAADQFAFDLLARTGTPALGATLFFQAQAYSLPNRGQFPSDKAWMDFMNKRSTHPLTTERLRAMARYASGDLAASRPAERAIWTGVGLQLQQIVDILEDRELQDCVARASEVGSLEALKPGRSATATLFRQACAK